MRAWLSPVGVAALFLSGMYGGMAIGALAYDRWTTALPPAGLAIMWLGSAWLDAIITSLGCGRWVQKSWWRPWYAAPDGEGG